MPGRVARVDRGSLTVLTKAGELRVLVAAQLAHDRDPLNAPTVGDWVVLQDGLLTEVLPRRSAIVRGGAGSPETPQVLAVNVDKVFVVCSLEDRFRARRLERLLVLAWQSGAAPVAVLTKADIVEDVAGAIAATKRLIGAGDVVAVSSISGLGMDAVRALLEPRATVVLIGPSGAGKSTLANRLGRGAVTLRLESSAATGGAATQPSHASSFAFQAERCSSTHRACGRSRSSTLTKPSGTPLGRSRSWQRRAVFPTVVTVLSPVAP